MLQHSNNSTNNNNNNDNNNSDSNNNNINENNNNKNNNLNSDNNSNNNIIKLNLLNNDNNNINNNKNSNLNSNNNSNSNTTNNLADQKPTHARTNTHTKFLTDTGTHINTRSPACIQVIMIMFGATIACLIQTVNRVSFNEDQSDFSHHVNFLVAFMSLIFCAVLIVLWTWRLIYPHALTSTGITVKIFLCYSPIVLSVVFMDVTWSSGFSTPISKVSATVYTFTVWLMLYAVVPWFYFRSVRYLRRSRALKKMLVFMHFMPALGYTAFVLSEFVNKIFLGVVIPLIGLGWVGLLIIDKKEIKSDKKDFGHVWLLSFLITAVPTGLGIFVVNIFDVVNQIPSLKFLVCSVVICCCIRVVESIT